MKRLFQLIIANELNRLNYASKYTIHIAGSRCSS